MTALAALLISSPPPAAGTAERNSTPAHQHPHIHRRAVLLQSAALALLLPPLAAPPPARAAAASNSFYTEWPYLVPADILPFIRATAPRGDAEAVLRSIDTFAKAYPMFRCGREKGALLEGQVAAAAPALALELGTFMGYGSIRIARNLPPGGRLVSLEADEAQAAVAREVLAWAGVPPARAAVVTGLAAEALPGLAAEAAAAAAGFVFLDHAKTAYLPDLLEMERLGLVGPGSVVLADNVVVPGAPGYLEHVMPRPEDGAAQAEGAPAPGACTWRTTLVDAEYEVEERYKQGWAPQRDAVAVSVCTARS
jgi:predicted O-methyltransferase YrrM